MKTDWNVLKEELLATIEANKQHPDVGWDITIALGLPSEVGDDDNPEWLALWKEIQEKDPKSRSEEIEIILAHSNSLAEFAINTMVVATRRTLLQFNIVDGFPEDREPDEDEDEEDFE